MLIVCTKVVCTQGNAFNDTSSVTVPPTYAGSELFHAEDNPTGVGSQEASGASSIADLIRKLELQAADESNVKLTVVDLSSQRFTTQQQNDDADDLPMPPPIFAADDAVYPQNFIHRTPQHQV